MDLTDRIPLQIGVTGGIGSGKSIVCKVFSCLGISVYDADTRAKWLTTHDSGIREKVVALLGPLAYDASGEYNRSYVASIVFKDELLLKKLNAIIHPVVLKDTEKWMSERGNQPYVIKEAAIMKAAGDANKLDYVVVVQAPQELRIRRILQRDKRSEDEIRAIIERQISDEKRKAIADFFIQNDENAALIPQVLDLHRAFLEKRKSR
ncbi:dephospho-CoA kinase [Dyadobacter sp. CY312]|uniref:dephospho-CoA kinase n=1 Tax=Dyadobacter sp. CY312 TaxID=2907303 RepID=UPI001EE9F945|nr:dephospho-CoA kinase [Dyadobacter sp. CY312]MCE7042575.1 dephospho-CoA kinase [Dyadobacter sp. CY312]